MTLCYLNLGAMKTVSLFTELLFSACVCVGEACWWTIHPASKQRSEGEKVRVGDDLILVSVSSERYLVSSSCAWEHVRRGDSNLTITFLLIISLHSIIHFF